MEDRIFFKDLKLTRRSFNQPVSCREYVDLDITESGDLQTVTGCTNLAQAIMNRLFTRKGELKRLGHPAYGSRLYELIGEPDNMRTRGLAELYIRECLNQEPGIRAVSRITFAPPSRGVDRNMLQATIVVKLASQDTETVFTIPVSLEG